MAKIGLIRHGSTSWNKEKRSQGHSNNPLDEDGIRQARALARRLSGQQWDNFFSSDLLRARQTAEILNEQLGIASIELDERLREMSRGLTEGTTEEERVQRWGADWRQQKLGIETVEEGMVRGSECIDEIADQWEGANILIVSHGAILRNSLRKLIPAQNVETLLNNTSITIINKKGSIWTCELYNCTAHLSAYTE